VVPAFVNDVLGHCAGISRLSHAGIPVRFLVEPVSNSSTQKAEEAHHNSQPISRPPFTARRSTSANIKSMPEVASKLQIRREEVLMPRRAYCLGSARRPSMQAPPDDCVLLLHLV